MVDEGRTAPPHDQQSPDSPDLEAEGRADCARDSQANPSSLRCSVQHVDRVARILERRLRNGGEREFSLAEAERINVSTGWTYRYLAASGHVIRAEGVSLPSDDLIAAWRLAKSHAASDVAA